MRFLHEIRAMSALWKGSLSLWDYLLYNWKEFDKYGTVCLKWKLSVTSSVSPLADLKQILAFVIHQSFLLF